jgi:general secretion pathway protein G
MIWPFEGNMQREKRVRVNLGAEEGFTLLEMLVVLAIIALLVGIVAPRVVQYLSRAKSQTAQTQLHNIASALDLYRLDIGHYPRQDEGLDALVTAPGDATNWNGPYLPKKEGEMDPWGEKFQYRNPGQHGEYDLFSYGADKVEGGTGEDKDIVNW